MSKQIPRGSDTLMCPMHKQTMELVCHKCPWWTQVRGTNPQTGAEMDEWNCAIALLPMLMINVARETREGAAATESFRNAVVDQRQRVATAIVAAQPQQLKAYNA